jgi:hypothetical protein
MNLEDRLRADMDRFTRDIRAPRGLALRAYQHGQKRRVRLRIAIAAGTAAALAASAVTAAGMTGAFVSAATRPVQTTAYILEQVDSALSPANVANVIGVIHTIDSPATRLEPFEGGPAAALGGLGPQWTVASIISWTYQGTEKFSYRAPAGRYVFDVKLSTAPGSVTQTAVIYGSGTWWTASWSTPAIRRRTKIPSWLAGDWPAFIKHALSAGAYRVAGYWMVDGINAIKLVATQGSAVLFVDPATYLPVRWDMGGSQTDYQWLPPTPANLALLNEPIPAGFRQVPPTQQ